MATNENLIPIPGRLHSVATEGHVAGADEIYDDNLGITLDQLSTKQATTGTTGDYPYNGMGRVFLKKNMVNGVNTLTQDMMPVATGGNTIYIIRYDFTLGEDITVPSNCVLQFEGGSITASGNNDTITGNNTGIQAGLVKLFNTDVTLAGTWNVAEAYPEWFDTDIQKALDSFPTVVLTGKRYLLSDTIQLNSFNTLKSTNKSVMSFNVSSGPLVSMGWYSTLQGLSVYHSSATADIISILCDITVINLTKDENKLNMPEGEGQYTRVPLTIKDCEISQYDAFIEEYSGKAIAIVAPGNYISASNYGFANVIIDGIQINSRFEWGVYIDTGVDSRSTIGGWVTDVKISNVKMQHTIKGIFVGAINQERTDGKEIIDSGTPSANQIRCTYPIRIVFDNISYQFMAYNSSLRRYAVVNAGTGISFKNSEYWDWGQNASDYKRPFLITPNKVRGIIIDGSYDWKTGSGEVIDYDITSLSELDGLEGVVYYGAPYLCNSTTGYTFNGLLVRTVNRFSDDGDYYKKGHLMLLPDGIYQLIAGDFAKLGLPNGYEDLSYLEVKKTFMGKRTVKAYVTTSGISDRVLVMICTIAYNEATSNIVWKPMPSTAWKGTTLPSMQDRAFDRGLTFYNDDWRCSLIWNGYAWGDALGREVLFEKNTVSTTKLIGLGRKIPFQQRGLRVYLHDINRIAFWRWRNSDNCGLWVEYDGNYAGVIRKGTTAQRPTGSVIGTPTSITFTSDDATVQINGNTYYYKKISSTNTSPLNHRAYIINPTSTSCVFLNNNVDAIFGKGEYIQYLNEAHNIYLATRTLGTYTNEYAYDIIGVGVGFCYFDTDLNKPIWVKETNATTGEVTWVDATGTPV